MKDKFDYIQAQSLCGINIGDTVKVIRKAGDDEQGWCNRWDSFMDEAIGNEYKVIFNNGVSGLTLDFDSDYDFPYFVLSKVIEKPEPSPQPTDDDFKGYNEEFMDACMKNAVDAIKAKRGYDQWLATSKPDNPKHASGYTATLTFDLTTQDGAEAWHIHKQAYELNSFAFEVLYNLSKNFERELDNEMVQINKGKDSDPVEILRRLINELSDNYNLNVN